MGQENEYQHSAWVSVLDCDEGVVLGRPVAILVRLWSITRLIIRLTSLQSDCPCPLAWFVGLRPDQTVPHIVGPTVEMKRQNEMKMKICTENLGVLRLKVKYTNYKRFLRSFKSDHWSSLQFPVVHDSHRSCLLVIISIFYFWKNYLLFRLNDTQRRMQIISQNVLYYEYDVETMRRDKTRLAVKIVMMALK